MNSSDLNPSKPLSTDEHPGRLLIVDPDADIARMLEARLTRENHTVLVAESGQAALALSKDHRIDVALVEKNLGDISGFELLHTLRMQQRHFEVIFTSVDPNVDSIVKALELGAYDLLVKPFANLKIVIQKVRGAVAKAHALRDRDDLARLVAAQTEDMAPGRGGVRKDDAGRDGIGSMGSGFVEIPASEIDLDGLSGTDSLTGLPNLRAGEQRFREEAARALRYGRPLCIAVARVDDLSRVIERFGEAVTNGVLRGVASMFSGMVRDVDFVARRQEGEFLLVFPETTKDRGAMVVERVRQAIRQTSFSDYMASGSNVDGFRLTMSFGISGLPADTMSAEALRSAADFALARATAAGDCVVLFAQDMARGR